jgi:predicted nuclease with RNAse H fold
VSIVGLDLAGVESRPSGFCLLKGFNAVTSLVYSDEEILGKIEESKPKVVAIDAPLSLPEGRKSIEERTNIHLRECDRELQKRGIRFFPITLGPMRKLTSRGMHLKQILETMNLTVIEAYPGGAQDILDIPRKQCGLEKLRKGLEGFGITGLNDRVSDHELDAVTCALVGKLFWEGKSILYGNDDQAIIMPRSAKASNKPTDRPRKHRNMHTNSSRFQTEAKKIVETVGLKWPPIGVTFSARSKEIAESSTTKSF